MATLLSARSLIRPALPCWTPLALPRPRHTSTATAARAAHEAKQAEQATKRAERAAAKPPDWTQHPTPIVGSFIFADATPTGPPRVALFQRSGSVPAYQHAWAPISGRVEASDATPLAAAWRELREELGLGRDELALLRRGPAYMLDDAALQTRWRVHPFAFRVRGALAERAEFRLGAEHAGYAWVGREAFAGAERAAIGDGRGEMVPGLERSLRRVWFSVGMGLRTEAVLAEGLREVEQALVAGWADTVRHRDQEWIQPDMYRDNPDHDTRSPFQRAIGKTCDKAGLVALKVLLRVLASLMSELEPAAWWREIRLAAWHVAQVQHPAWADDESGQAPNLSSWVVNTEMSVEPVVLAFLRTLQCTVVSVARDSQVTADASKKRRLAKIATPALAELPYISAADVSTCFAIFKEIIDKYRGEDARLYWFDNDDSDVDYSEVSRWDGLADQYIEGYIRSTEEDNMSELSRIFWDDM